MKSTSPAMVLALVPLALLTATSAVSQVADPGVWTPSVHAVAAVPGAPPRPRPPAREEDFARTTVAAGLSDPFEILVAPDGSLWATERTAGRVVRIDPGTGATQTLLSIGEVVATPGVQDGLLGMTLNRDPSTAGHRRRQGGPHRRHPLRAYLSYTYDGDPGPGLDRRQRIVRYSYAARRQQLVDPQVVIEGLLASDDHNSGRLRLGRDRKLWYTIGDRGNNQDFNACRPNEAQRLPTAREVRAQDWTAYQGKTLRLNTDGSVPRSNPRLGGVRSHVWTLGHRNAQGLAFDDRGHLYSSEQGPKTDDELNLLRRGRNYGWPLIAGYRDDAAYVYGNWSARASGCDPGDYDPFVIPADVPQQAETDVHRRRLVAPVRTFYTVPAGFDFLAQAQRCAPSGFSFICYPTVAPSSLEHYGADAIAGWADSWLMPTLKRGTLFRMPVRGETRVDGPLPLFRSQNRYRDTAISPDGRTIYVATDSGGVVEGLNGVPTRALADPGAILAFTYTG
jgi:PQQ-dependent dehydrogenase (s-GDH family)